MTSENKKFWRFSPKENLFLLSLDPDFFELQMMTGDDAYLHYQERETRDSQYSGHKIVPEHH